MRNRIRLTFGKKLVILYLCIFTSSYYLTHTLVFALVRNSLLAAAMENEALTSGYVAERLQYYFNLLDSILFMMGAILAVSFFLIYAMNIIPLRRLCNAAKHFSIHQKNEPITLHTSVHSFPIFPMIFVHRLLQFMDMRRQCSMVRFLTRRRKNT